MRPLPGRRRRGSRRRASRGSARIAASCGAHQPICSADAAAGLARRNSRRDPVGLGRPPTRAPACRPSSRRRRTPTGRRRGRRRARPRRAPSRGSVTSGKRLPHGLPSGAVDDGPGAALAAAEHVGGDDEPAVGSSARPGPTRAPTSPGRVAGPGGPATWLSPVSACSTRTALAPSARACPTSRRRSRRRAARRRTPAAAARRAAPTGGGRAVPLPPRAGGREGAPLDEGHPGAPWRRGSRRRGRP